jgi:membrane protein DedA with SNARE-associated domain
MLFILFDIEIVFLYPWAVAFDRLGAFGLVEAIAWTTAGSVVGALILYLLGALVGRERTRSLMSHIPLVELSDIDRSEAFFTAHGRAAVFFGRMIPVFRSLISLPAGVERMRVSTFVLLTAAGSAIWNTIFVCAGYLLGENWGAVEKYAGVLEWVVIAIVVGAVGWFVISRLRAGSRRTAGESGAGGSG